MNSSTFIEKNACAYKSQALNKIKYVAAPSVIYDKSMLEMDIQNGILLGKKGANKELYLYRSETTSVVLLELGRLRELTFRELGLGTGKKYDLDAYDYYYDHLILWDKEDQSIIGSYRLIPCLRALENRATMPSAPLYTQTIFNYSDRFFDN